MTPISGVTLVILVSTFISYTDCKCSLISAQLRFNDWTGTLQSPGFESGKYPLGEECVWRITLSKGSRIRVVFDQFDLDPGTTEVVSQQSKCQDYVQITEGVKATGQEVNKYCGGTIPPPFLSRTNDITVTFVSDEIGGKKGFKLGYSGSCENINVTESGSVVESPNYPRPPPATARCQWWVSVPDNRYPLVNVIDFQTNATKCDDAIINMYGSFDDSNWVCKERIAPVRFNGNKMVIEYTKKPTSFQAIFSLDVTFVDKCTDERCENGGSCEEELLGVVCKCTPQFSGKTCEVKQMTCADMPCQNQAECIETDDEIVCECTPGYTGPTCKLTINECAPNPCLQGGTCVDKSTDYSCICPEGYAGKNCENPLSQCDNTPCMNGGTCQDFRNGFICLCLDGFTGETCQETLSSCDQTTCIHGVCQGSPDGSMCECKKGFSGDRCDINIDDCQNNPCNTGSTCIDEDDGFRCSCLPGFTGDRCFGDIAECSQNPCKNNGTCTNLTPGFQCECSAGFKGELCEDDLNECVPNPCKGEANCMDLPGGFQCDCPPGFTGRTCDTNVNPCSSNPCLNGAPCVATTSAIGPAYVCECPLGYDGGKCEKDINECLPDPCSNGGVCKNMVNDFICQCPRGFRGKMCDILSDACASQPCGNNGRCVDKVGAFECECNPGYTGPLCDNNINECTENPCQNNGSCSSNNGVPECVCVNGFEGPTCNTNINECNVNPCQRGGQCEDLINDFRCECAGDFRGKRCEHFIYQDSPHCTDEVADNSITWFSTKTGSEARRPCPPGINGHATRVCNKDKESTTGGSWEQADLRSCVSPLLMEISKDAQRLLTSSFIRDRQIVAVTAKITNATNLHSGSTLYPGDLITAAETLGILAVAMEKATVSGQGLRRIAQSYVDAVENIIGQDTDYIWKKVNDIAFVEEKLTDIIESTELLAENMASKLALSYKRRKRGLYDTMEDSSISVLKKNMEFQIKMSTGHISDSMLVYHGQSMSSCISLPPSLMTTARASGHGTFGVYNGKFSSLASLLTPRLANVNRTTNRTEVSVINSDVIAAKVLGVPDVTFNALNDPVVVTFQLKNPSLWQPFGPMCSFLNASARFPAERWPRTGCEIFQQNLTHVTCHCYHLTNFAVLMDVYGITDRLDVIHQKALSFISYIGGTLSILGCILAIAVFEYFRLKSDRVRIHEQLAISIILVQFIFLVGIDRKENPHVCKVFAVLLHYSLLAMFCWMLVEGIHLYVILVKVFKKGSHLKKYMVLGWGIPLVIVAVSVGVFYDDYGQGEMCWMTNFMLLVLFVPIATVVILLNVFVLVVVIRVMMKSFTISGKTNSEEASSLRITFKAAAVLLPLLGLTWSFCFLSFDTEATLLFTYLFTLFNCLQGVLFFVFHCLLNIDVRKAYERRYKRRKQTSVNAVHGDRGAMTRRKSSLINTDSDPFVDTGPFNGSSLSYRSSTKSDDTEFSELSYYSKQSLPGSKGTPINNLSSTVHDSVRLPSHTAESQLSNLPGPT